MRDSNCIVEISIAFVWLCLCTASYSFAAIEYNFADLIRNEI